MSSQRVPVRFQRTVDGDTVYVVPERGGGSICIRLMGIDAPESDQHWGREATDELNKLLTVSGTDTLWLEQYGLDSSRDRTVGLLYWNYYGRTRSINREMVWRGFAHIDEHPQGKHDLAPLDFYHAAEQAREKRLGIWRSPDQDRDLPRAFRARQRQEGQQDDTRLRELLVSVKALKALLFIIFLVLAFVAILLYIAILEGIVDFF